MTRFRRAVGVLQPCYLPWLGYFEQMAYVDRFVLLDDVQYTHQDWRNRNRIKAASGSIWLTVPIRRCPHDTLIRDIEVNYDHPWPRKHLRTIEQNYGKCSHFEPFFDELSTELQRPATLLAELDHRLLRLAARYLEIDTPISFSSELAIAAGSDGKVDKNQRLIEICSLLGADRLYEGASGVNYIDVARFRRAGIEVVWQSYQHPTYPQCHGPFLSHQSAIDLIMNAGPEAPAILRLSPVPELLRKDRTPPVLRA